MDIRLEEELERAAYWDHVEAQVDRFLELDARGYFGPPDPTEPPEDDHDYWA